VIFKSLLRVFVKLSDDKNNFKVCLCIHQKSGLSETDALDIMMKEFQAIDKLQSIFNRVLA